MRISVAGIEASSGGLEALKILLAHLHPKAGLAIVFDQKLSVQPLEFKHHSNLTETLARVRAMSIRQTAHSMEIEPGHLNSKPPDADLERLKKVVSITLRAPMHFAHYRGFCR
jgi:two-component system CheB/CheR fusion protein